MEIKIGNKLIGEGQPCFIIAEAGVNHNGSLELAKKLIDAAKESGSDSIKFQTFKSERIATADAEMAKYQKENTGKEEAQLEMLKRAELSYGDFRELKKYCDEKGIIFLSTPHSCNEDVDLVAELCPAIKVASGDLTNIPLLKYIARKNLPIILSTGMSAMEEVENALEAVKKEGNDKIIILHCTNNYPCPINEVNLRAINTLKEKFKLPTGYSDHTEGINISTYAAAAGACVLEKHLTLDKNLPGPDHKASLEAEDLKEMVLAIRNLERALGDGVKKPAESELETAKIARKSLVAQKDIKKGEAIREGMITVKRPGTGIPPGKMNEIIGKKAARDIKKDSLFVWEDFV